LIPASAQRRRRFHSKPSQGVGGLRNALAQDARRREHLVAGETRLDELLVRAHELDVLVGEQALAAAGCGRPSAFMTLRAMPVLAPASRTSPLSVCLAGPPSAPSTAAAASASSSHSGVLPSIPALRRRRMTSARSSIGPPKGMTLAQIRPSGV
jgi:hypothetical protein